ncbi:Aminotransferase like protein [Verticillium longisporum]|uniref:Aminotransferase like protein n=1 Tax=Verticillium longisporum TaxID=100787 RepID=A0A8I3AL72_VERLO|nr:Aminotransferase like protein [Verticillium longisporum]
MKAVCEKYGALLILDEVMCGMGRTGTLHAWQDEGVAPDLQTIGKGLGGGYRPVAGLLISRRIVDVLENGSGIFVHGHTYQAHLSACAAALEVQRIVVSDNLLENVRDKGSRLSRQLRSNLDSHAHVGDIRGKGLFWGVEFVFDRRTKDPFPRHAQIAARLSDLALTEPYGITVYPGAGTVDGYSGDHIILAPPYTITDSDVDLLVESVTKLIRHFFHYEINLPEKSRDS